MHLRGLRAPNDIAVIGVGDIAAARVSIPALSTIGFDYAEQGRELAQAVADRLDAGDDERPASVEGLSRPRLILRTSA